MSLSGNLGFVPIDEVLRLLTRSHQQGSVAVTGMGLHGRVFIGKGGVDLATTSDNDELYRHLVNSGYADEKSLSRIATGETTLAAIAEANESIVGLIREMTVESLYQMATRGDEFVVHEGATSPYASPKSFELEALLRDTDERKREWDKVSDVIPDLSGGIRFRRDLGEREEVTVKSEDWKVLSEIGGGSSVREIADHLGTTEFWTARVAARLVKEDLVVLGVDVPEERDMAGDYASGPVEDPAPGDEYAVYETERVVTDESYESVSYGDSERSVERFESDTVEPDADGSWWQEPEPEDEQFDEDRDTRTPEVVSEGLSEMPSVEATDEEDDDDDDVEEDTEAFLEKVFSELESSDSEDEGHGLLRRRRMGTLRDFSSDS